MKERLHKALAHAGVASRRHVEDLIRQGRVTVNGKLATVGVQADLELDAVKVDGKRILPPRRPRRYYLVHKPAGYISTADDPEGRPTVLDLLPVGLRGGLVPVGRLDFESEGLLLLTDDGELAQKVTHPRYGCRKTYEVKVKGQPDLAALSKLRDGIVLEGRKTAPAVVEPLRADRGKRIAEHNTWWRVVLGEGRNRQVREMFFRVGHPVSRLRRVAIGPLRDPYLTRGSWRALDPAEVEALRAASSGRAAPVKRRTTASPAAKSRTPASPSPKSRTPTSAPASKRRTPRRSPAKGSAPEKPPPKGRPRGRSPR